jgi:hypothetical protein
MATFMVVERYVYYLKHDQFIIKINHESLKFILEKKFQTHIQKKSSTKLLKLKYIIQYKKGKENMVADALSINVITGRQLENMKEKNSDLTAITIIKQVWYNQVGETHEGDELFKKDCKRKANQYG